MKVGDLVRWIGYPGASVKPSLTGPSQIGLIVNIMRYACESRVDVLWGGGKIGKNLYPQTLEVIDESR